MAINKTMIKKLIKYNESFAIMQYYIYFRGVQSETQKRFEIMFIKYDEEGEAVINYEDLTGEDLKYFFQNINLFEEKINDKSGIIWEKNNFKINYELIINKIKN